MNNMHTRSQGDKSPAPIPILSTSASLTLSEEERTTVAAVDSGPSLALSSRSPWLPILEASNQLVLYDPTSHALSITAPSLLPVPTTQGWVRHANTSHDHNSGHAMGLEDDSMHSHHHDTSLATVPVRHQLSQSINGGGELRSCPWCSRPFSPGFSDIRRDGFSRRAPNYFQLLEQANYEAHSQPVSPPQSPPRFLSPLSSESHFHSEGNLRSDTPDVSVSGGQSFEGGALDALGGVRHRLGGGRLDSGDSIPGTPKRRFGDSSMAQGYFAAFFKEERRLGMGANGTVYLCQVRLCIVYSLLTWLNLLLIACTGWQLSRCVPTHPLVTSVLHPTGRFAVKKIAVGHSHEYLLRILREVRLLESLRHPNIISYHHSWLETNRFSSFGPSIPTLQ